MARTQNIQVQYTCFAPIMLSALTRVSCQNSIVRQNEWPTIPWRLWGKNRKILTHTRQQIYACQVGSSRTRSCFFLTFFFTFFSHKEFTQLPPACRESQDHKNFRQVISDQTLCTLALCVHGYMESCFLCHPTLDHLLSRFPGLKYSLHCLHIILKEGNAHVVG